MSPVRPATGPVGSSRPPCCASPFPGPKYQSCCDWLRGTPVCTTQGPGRDSGSLCPHAIRARATPAGSAPSSSGGTALPGGLPPGERRPRPVEAEYAQGAAWVLPAGRPACTKDEPGGRGLARSPGSCPLRWDRQSANPKEAEGKSGGRLPRRLRPGTSSAPHCSACPVWAPLGPGLRDGAVRALLTLATTVLPVFHGSPAAWTRILSPAPRRPRVPSCGWCPSHGGSTGRAELGAWHPHSAA